MKPTAPDLVWVDLETGGLDPRRHDILELAAARTSGVDGRVIGHLEAKVLPADPDRPRVTTKAAAVNGFDPDLWREEAHPLREVLKALAELARDAILAGHNVAFDRRFLTVAAARCDILIPTRAAPAVDTMEIARPLKAKGRVSSIALEALCQHFGIRQDRQAHRAGEDVARSIALYRRLRRLYAAGGGP